MGQVWLHGNITSRISRFEHKRRSVWTCIAHHGLNKSAGWCGYKWLEREPVASGRWPDINNSLNALSLYAPCFSRSPMLEGAMSSLPPFVAGPPEGPWKFGCAFCWVSFRSVTSPATHVMWTTLGGDVRFHHKLFLQFCGLCDGSTDLHVSKCRLKRVLVDIFEKYVL